ncbi:MAG: heparinase II/III family protein [Rhodospirillales bacterium]
MGSGWRRIEYGMICPGLNGKSFPPFTKISPNVFPIELIERLSPGNRDRATAIRYLIDSRYTPIDWHLDFKSGFRWPENRVAAMIAYGHDTGADVKVPWELARLQHLPQLALAFIAAKQNSPGFEAPERYAREFADQTLDFLAANPPGFGVNWSCTMDVAIRAANLLLTFDLFKGRGHKFDEAFTREFTAAVWAHGRHIVRNLEWAEDFRGNHFLADVVGLAFAAAYLPQTPETDVWLAFAVYHLVTEVEHQFAEDGSNFEASTSYHRLSSEMVVFATALVLGLSERRLKALQSYDHRLWKYAPPLPPAPLIFYDPPVRREGDAVDSPFPGWYFERLERMAEFAMHATKPDGAIVQIGDNDSGRLFKLSPNHRALTRAQAKARYPALEERDDLPETYWDEDDLDRRALVAAINALFGREDLAGFHADAGRADAAIVKSLARGAQIAGAAPPKPLGRRIAKPAPADDPQQPAAAEIHIPLSEAGIHDGLQNIAYPDFGLFIWRSPRFFLSVRCGPVGQEGRGGHAHNDQLAIELWIDGADWLRDPGSGLYTPDLAVRNAYRSVRAHATPRIISGEPASLGLGVFRLEDNAHATCHRFDAGGFLGSYSHREMTIYREIVLRKDELILRDKVGNGDSESPPQTVTLASPDAAKKYFAIAVPFSPGYGKIFKAS